VLAFLLAAVLAADPTSQGGVVVEEIVAVLRNPAGTAPRPITLTKLVEEARVALVGRGALDAASGPIDGPALAATLDWLVDETLVADEAARLRLDELARGSLEEEVARFTARFPGPAEYRAFLARAELTEEELAATLARGLRARRYLESRVGRSARVSEADVDREVAARLQAGVTAPVREAVRAELVADRARAQTAVLLRELRARADVRVLARPGAAAPRAEAGP
jgi:hypothetical protein